MNLSGGVDNLEIEKEREVPMKKSSASNVNQQEWPVLAICYDFDKTLSPRNMQEFGLIQKLGYADTGQGFKRFWDEVNNFSQQNKVGKYLAGMYYVVAKMFEKHVEVSADSFARYGAKVKLHEGVATWFDRIRKYGDRHKVKVEHYIISAGFKEMLNGVRVGKKTLDKVVDRIYASSFFFGRNGKDVWPATVIDYTGKTQMLYRIKKNMMDENDENVNNPVEKERIPFQNMIYIGDSETDVPCMKIVKEHGGVSIGVYSPTTANKDRIIAMMRDGRISFYTPASYTAGSDIEKLVKLIIDKTEKIARYEREQEKMVTEFDRELKKIDDSKIALKSPANQSERNGKAASEHTFEYDLGHYRELLNRQSTFLSPCLSKDFDMHNHLLDSTSGQIALGSDIEKHRIRFSLCGHEYDSYRWPLFHSFDNDTSGA